MEDFNQQNYIPEQEKPMNELSEPQKKSTGAVIGSIIVIVVIIVGGLYLWGKQISEKRAQESMTPEQILSEPDNSLNALQNQSKSDEVSDIEKDLNATDLNELDKELQNIDEELK